MITINKQPARYSPSNNPLFLSMTSNDNTIVYFTIKIYKAGNILIGNLKAYPSPSNKLSAGIDLSPLLNSYTSTEIANTSGLLASFGAASVLDYSITIQEMLINGVAGTTTTINDLSVYNASLSDFEFNMFGYRNYYMNSVTTATFLTTKPAISNVNPWSKEFLYFLADANSTVNKVIIKTYTAANVTQIYTTSYTPVNRLHRLNLSPKDLKVSKSINFDNIVKYEVWIENSAAGRISEIRTYRCVNFNCRVEPVNVLWLNSYGGVDSFTFINPQESKSISRSTIKSNRYQDYTISNGGVINQNEKTYNVKSTSEYTLTTNILNDYEYIYLSDMLASEQVYIELSDGTLYPVSLSTTAVDVKRNKYSTSANRFELKFQAESNLTLVPDSYLSFASGVTMLGFSVPEYLAVTRNYYETTIGDATSLYFTVVHNLKTTNIAIDLVLISNGQSIYGDVVRTNTNTISIEFGEAIATNSVKVMITKLD